MCRLLGYVTREPVTAAHLLNDTLQAFVEMSHLHGDGWVLAQMVEPVFGWDDEAEDNRHDHDRNRGVGDLDGNVIPGLLG